MAPGRTASASGKAAVPKKVQKSKSVKGCGFRLVLKGKTVEVLHSQRLQFGPNVKKPGTACHARYHKFSLAKTLGQALRLGASASDVRWSIERSQVKLVGGAAASVGTLLPNGEKRDGAKTGGRSMADMPAASAKDGAITEHVLAAFTRKMRRADKAEGTVSAYAASLAKLFRAHQVSWEAMHTEEFYRRVRLTDEDRRCHGNSSSAVRAFLRFVPSSAVVASEAGRAACRRFLAALPAEGPAKASGKGGAARRPARPTARGKKYKVTVKNGIVHVLRPCGDKKGWAKRRAPEKPPPGGWPKPPAHWPAGVRVDIGRPAYWLPEGWGQGVKTTCATKLPTFISPEGKCYYHRNKVEEAAGVERGEQGRDSAKAMEWTTNWAKMQIAAGTNFSREEATFDTDGKLFANLTKSERAHLAKSADDFHFAVVSARRTQDEKGLRYIVNVQAQLTAAGARPVWYVDEASLKSYRQLGLDAKVGGKLVPARNLALADAARKGKPCVQVSDDILRWDFYVGATCRQVDLFAGNEAARSAEHFRVSPVAAARYLLAKMRGVGAGEARPRLGGVFPLGNTGQSFTREAVSREHFILGDFFVADLSPCRFDARMSLKEDYDFTCAHLARHGSVYRANRMFVAAVHETNAGGAVDARDESGKKERENIAILQEKWPGVFYINGRRGNATQVVMTWRRRRLQQ